MTDEQIQTYQTRLTKLNEELTSGDVSPDAFKEVSKLSSILSTIDSMKKMESELADLEGMIKDEDTSTDLKILAKEDRDRLQTNLDTVTQHLDELINTKEKIDNAIIEIRAGAGGDEASLFAADLYKMYTNYATKKHYKITNIDTSYSALKGFKEVIFKVAGDGAYSDLEFESGVHRVQRVPVTESSGRIHTSTVSVAVLPEVADVDIQINPADLRIDVFRSSGPGGQSVNTTDSAVRVTHIPTGIVVTCQDSKSQIQNREQAIIVLKARLYDIEQQRVQKERGDMRKSQIGTGDRSEKIRTYNYQQDRVTDHRIKKSWHGLASIMEGNIDDIIKSLHEANNAL